MTQLPGSGTIRLYNQAHRPDITETDVPARLLKLRRRQKTGVGGGDADLLVHAGKLRPSPPGTANTGSLTLLAPASYAGFRASTPL